MSNPELSAWLRLLYTEGVGNDAARKLLAAFGLPTAIFEQPAINLGKVVSERQARALQSAPPELEKQLDLCGNWLAASSSNRRIITLDDALYPSPLLALNDPPLVLWLMGRVDLLTSHGWPASISMVGSRNPSAQGAQNAFAFAAHFAGAGMAVVSGMALGIDAAAHDGALQQDTQAIQTIAVVGTGLDRVYPKKNLELAHRIASSGLLLSEFPLDTPPLAANFPKRNRLIAALGRGTLVVEAALQSGSLITARESLELGKDVFAVPGSIHAAQAKGCHALIKQGAKLVECADDVIDELRWLNPAHNPETPKIAPTLLNSPIDTNRHPHSVLQAMGHDPVSFDALAARGALSTADLQVVLLELELAGAITRLDGGLFQVFK